jgi:hypothetical protein
MNFEDIQQLADSISRFTNKATTEETEELGRLLNVDHRILVQKKMGIFRGYLEQLKENSDNGLVDLRNEAAAKVAIKILKENNLSLPCI